MTDPFADLREPATPIDPDPVFARRLRARMQRALALPKGVVPVTATLDQPTRTVPAAVPYLAVADARAAIDWYIDVFDATVVGEPVEMPDGRIGHAELAIGDGVLYVSDQHPEIGVVAPTPGAATVSLMLPVDDADGVRERALRRGATGDREPYDGYGERHAWIVDPFGHRWGLTSPLRETADVAYRHGDVVYVSIWAPSAQRARDFYTDVVGWRLDDHGPIDTSPHVGMHDGPGGEYTLFCCYAVSDLDTALERVAAAGGRAGTPVNEPFGRVATCNDDQGTSFALLDVPVVAGNPPPANGNGPGDLSYLTLHVVDSGRARAFYGSVLGWTFEPGRIDDGWQVPGVAPMTGISGGHERGGAVPQWIVADLARAVAAVRDHGGTSTDPEQQPYGLTATCVDDQGLPFYLVQG